MIIRFGSWNWSYNPLWPVACEWLNDRTSSLIFHSDNMSQLQRRNTAIFQGSIANRYSFSSVQLWCMKSQSPRVRALYSTNCFVAFLDIEFVESLCIYLRQHLCRSTYIRAYYRRQKNLPRTMLSCLLLASISWCLSLEAYFDFWVIYP